MDKSRFDPSVMLDPAGKPRKPKKRDIHDARGGEKASHRLHVMLTDADRARLTALAAHIKPQGVEFPNDSAAVRWVIQQVYDTMFGGGR